mgnify:FL=1|tara:strand:+ start:895 stop:1137 length:243 start_codon:yes stop_codon:yes gene_type:complete
MNISEYNKLSKESKETIQSCVDKYGSGDIYKCVMNMDDIISKNLKLKSSIRYTAEEIESSIVSLIDEMDDLERHTNSYNI